MNHLESFAEAARRFEAWIDSPRGSSQQEVREALRMLFALCSAVLELGPLPEYPDRADLPEPGLTEDEWREVHAKASRLPVSYYSEVVDPLAVPGEEPMVGDLADDLSDIYRDIVGALRLFDGGHAEAAHWHWVFGVQHWGQHATSAIRVLHWYLVDNDAFQIGFA